MSSFNRCRSPVDILARLYSSTVENEEFTSHSINCCSAFLRFSFVSMSCLLAWSTFVVAFVCSSFAFCSFAFGFFQVFFVFFFICFISFILLYQLVFTFFFLLDYLYD